MLELKGLTRRYGDLVALDDLSFTVAEGQMFGFVGPNGAGKITANAGIDASAGRLCGGALRVMAPSDRIQRPDPGQVDRLADGWSDEQPLTRPSEEVAVS
jgi:ABC-2 type transport system ATP-binding protein